MRTALWIGIVALLAGILVAQTQSQPQAEPQTQPQVQAPAPADQQTQPQVYGRGRGGIPYAWNDTDKDGICDLTGRPVPQAAPVGPGRGWGAAAWGGRGRGWGRGWGRGRATGWGRGRGAWVQQVNPRTPAPPAQSQGQQ
jgi:hypothetical protein